MRQRTRKSLAVSQLMLLMASLGGLGAVETLGGDRAIAQDAATEGETVVPGASQLLAPPSTSVAPAESRPAPAPSRPAATAAPETFSPEPSSTQTNPAPRSASPSIDLSTVDPEFSVNGNSSQSQGSQSQGSAYIDTTDYGLGATPLNPLPSVVLSERSTGCSTVIRQGQSVPGSICSGASGQGSLARTGAQGSVVYGSAPDAFQVGPLSIGPNGIRVTRSLNINDYYNRTQRPSSFAGNGNSNLMFPLSAPAIVTSPFGWRVHPLFGSARMHTGTDLAAPMGTPVVAAYSGRVTVSDFVGGYGLTVVLRHDEQTTETLYGHLSETFVRPGEMIEQGDVIGRVGSTGNSTGPHLHFELRRPSGNGWVAVNTGPLMQSAIAQVQQGLRLAADVEEQSDDHLIALDIPDYLQGGKNAVKSPELDEAQELSKAQYERSLTIDGSEAP
ncbi:MAG: M23 family metallopeptidase [Elainellaceae cyanobacterium]